MLDVVERRLADAMAAAKETLDGVWAADDGLEGAAFVISIPEQTVEVQGRERVEYALGVLRGAGVRGTYRAVRS